MTGPGSSSADPLGLYTHVPFCSAICNYCNFNRGVYDAELKARYVDALVREIEHAGDRAPADTLFFGGGTPSLLTPDDVARIVDACHQAFALTADAEVTLEMNPESCDEGYVRAVMSAGVTRISLGVQSLLDDELRRLGRLHTAGQARDAISAIRRAGCGDLSVDLMLWLPGQTQRDCAASVEAMVRLEPDHVSLYLLELYPNAPLREEMARGGWSLAPQDDAAAMYLDALARTDRAGYRQYEISNVARSGHRARHNLKYWQDGQWLGFGCGAHSTRGGGRWRNLSETGRYIEAVERARPVREGHRQLTMQERLGDALFTGLRLADGIDVQALGNRYQTDLRARFGPALRGFVEGGLLIDEEGRWRLTRPGMLVSSEVMTAFV